MLGLIVRADSDRVSHTAAVRHYVLQQQRAVPSAARGAYRSPKNLRTRADLRARTRKNGSENTT